MILVLIVEEESSTMVHYNLCYLLLMALPSVELLKALMVIHGRLRIQMCEMQIEGMLLIL